MRGERVWLAAGLVLAAGCYSYTPTRVESVAPGQEVRVRLTPEQAARLEEMRRTDVRLMNGTILDSSATGLTVNTAVSRRDPMAGTRTLVQSIDVPASGVVEVEIRELDRVKTGAVIGGVLAAAVWGIVAATGDAEGGSNRPPSPPPPESRIPVRSLFQFAFPF